MSGMSLTQIQKLIPRLASSHDGEVIATRNAIDRALRADGQDWHDLAAACSPRASLSLPHRGASGRSTTERARWLRDNCTLWRTDRELEFVYTMCRCASPSPRQTQWLNDIYDRFTQEVAA